VTAVLGPTNTGKTHLAIERMLGHETGLIGLPLRLLAREVYDKIAARIGADKVALITGEEKIKPESPRYWVATVEAMPRDVDVDFLAVDEVQLAADPERGHVFTDRLLHARGKLETLLLGAQTMRDIVSGLLPGANHVSRPRLSKLTYAGQKKLSRLPRRTAVVAFSASDVYAVAELIRRQRGGAAVVLGALSPRTRNAQVALYQNGDVDYMIATDAIGMGLNLDVDHIAFAGTRKFDGQSHRELSPAELAQIAGRAGRYMNDGSFGVTGEVEPFANDLVERLETHSFEPLRILQWRNRELDFTTLDALRESLRALPGETRLQRARMGDDMIALENLALDRTITDLAKGRAAVERLWQVCQVPDYRKISSANHAELVAQIYKYLLGPEGRIPEDWFRAQVSLADRSDGDIDTIATRIAHIRTWTFVANRPDWLADPAHWQGQAREIEDKLSDALHERLTQRFVDRRTSALMRKLNDKDDFEASIAEDGAIHVEKHFVGRLKGFRFFPDAATPSQDGIHGKAARNAASHVVAKEIGMRVRRIVSAGDAALKITRAGRIMWRGEEVARLEATDDALKPQVHLIADEHLTGPDRERVQKRVEDWLARQIEERLKPIVELSRATDVTGLERGIAFRLKEGFGVLKREDVAEEIRSLDQNARAQLRRFGVRFGAFNIYFPLLLKPAAAELALALWALKHAREHGLDPENLPEPPRPGLTSVVADATKPEAFYRAAGFHSCGPRTIRIDMLERLADLIRPLTAYRAKDAPSATPPKGASGDGGFSITPEMMSILGCSAEELGLVLKALGFWAERRRKAAAPAPLVPAVAQQQATLNAEAMPIEAPPFAGPPVEPTMTATEAGEAAQTAAVMEPATTGVQAAPAEPVASSLEANAVAGSPVTDPTPQEAAASAAPAEEEFEEIWRPRRRVNHERRPDQRRQQHKQPGERDRERQSSRRREHVGDRRQAKSEVGPPGEKSPSPPNKERRGFDGKDRRKDRREREERPRLAATTESKRVGGIDPNSPFAALGRLKAELEKRAADEKS
jgi:ATP-dependent RNA helicase SUPV3L1/SUV3